MKDPHGRYFDRTGAPIDLMRWADLSEDPEYRFVTRAEIATPDGQAVAVIVMWRGLDPYRVEPPFNIFEISTWAVVVAGGVALHIAGRDDAREWDMIDDMGASTELAALALHRHQCERAQRGEL